MKRTTARLAALILVLALLPLLVPEPASANPGFARKFGFSCVMCHAGFPKLNSFGESFAANGYQMPGGSIASGAVATGDPKLFLDKNVNLAARVDAYFRLRPEGDTHSDLETPAVLKIFLTGYLADNITFYSYFMANEGGEVAGIEDAFLYLNNLAGQDLDVQIGQFQVMDPVFSREQRLTFQDIEIYLVRPGDSPFELTYQRGGLVSYGLGPLGAVFGIVNGNGIGTGDDSGNLDDSTPKDVFGRVSSGWGPVDVGLFGYKGIEPNTAGDRSNQVLRYGPDLRIRRGMFDLRGEWLVGTDWNPGYASPAERVRHAGGFAELDVHFNPDWTGVLFYNYIGSGDAPYLERNLGTVNLTYYFLRNLKGFVEYTHDFHDDTPDHPARTHSGTTGFVLAF